MARKPIKTSLHFESSFKVRGKVTQVVLCGCEKEGDLGLRVTRDPERTWDYDPEDPKTFVDVYAYCDDDSWQHVRGGEWVEATITCTGYLRKVWGGKIYLEKGALTPGGLKVGRVDTAEDRLAVDFGVFTVTLRFDDPEKLREALKREGLRAGAYAETDCDVYIQVQKHGTKREVLRERGLKQVFPSRTGESRYHA